MNALTEYRLQAKLTKKALSKRTGVSRTTIVNIEAGRIKPNDATLAKLAEVLRVPIAEFIERIRNPE